VVHLTIVATGTPLAATILAVFSRGRSEDVRDRRATHGERHSRRPCKLPVLP
jgi:hypothetical protein